MGGAHLCKASPGTDSNYCQDLKENALVEWPAKEQGGGGGGGCQAQEGEAHGWEHSSPIFVSMKQLLKQSTQRRKFGSESQLYWTNGFGGSQPLGQDPFGKPLSKNIWRL